MTGTKKLSLCSFNKILVKFLQLLLNTNHIYISIKSQMSHAKELIAICVESLQESPYNSYIFIVNGLSIKKCIEKQTSGQAITYLNCKSSQEGLRPEHHGNILSTFVTRPIEEEQVLFSNCLLKINTLSSKSTSIGAPKVVYHCTRGSRQTISPIQIDILMELEMSPSV